jgi:putative redox protein
MWFFYLEGEIKEDKAAKAAQLSFEKYCLSKTLEPTATIHYKVVLNGLNEGTCKWCKLKR